MRRILLLGSSGQIGWELTRTLACLGAVAAPQRHQADLADADAIRAAIRDLDPQLIVNAAAYTAVDRAESEETLATQINGIAPGIIAEEAKRLAIPLVHFSTDYIFAGDAVAPYREEDPVAPINAYGRSKLSGEEAIRSVGAAHLILRTAWIYSLRGSNFLLTVLRLARSRRELRIVDDQIGSPTWARLVAEAVALILAATATASGWQPLTERGGVYHLAASGRCSWFDFATAIVSRMGDADGADARVLPIHSAEYPVAARRPSYSVLDTGLLADRFGLRLPDWREGLDLCLGDGLPSESGAR